MSYSSLSVANAFLDLAKEEERPLTNMQVQKLVFLAQGYSLALMDNKPIHYHDTYAWQFGPVIKELYNALQKYGRDLVSEKLDTPGGEMIDADSPEMFIVEGVMTSYGHMTAGQLSRLTHKLHSPWTKTWNKNRFGQIPNRLIGDYYKDMVSSG